MGRGQAIEGGGGKIIVIGRKSESVGERYMGQEQTRER